LQLFGLILSASVHARAATSLRSDQGPRTQDVLEAAANAQERGVAASMARSKTSGLRAGLAERESTKLADTAAQSAAGMAGVADQILAMEAEANASAAEALDAKVKLKGLLETVPQRAELAAAKAAEQEVKRLSEEANHYFQQIDEAATANFPRMPSIANKLEEAAEARKPYDEGKKAVSEVARRYNEAAIKLASQTQTLVSQAFEEANRAVESQREGSTQAARQGMAQAWQTMQLAKIKKHEARAARRFAESVNSVVPSYVKGAQMAVENVLGIASSGP